MTDFAINSLRFKGTGILGITFRDGSDDTRPRFWVSTKREKQTGMKRKRKGQDEDEAVSLLFSCLSCFEKRNRAALDRSQKQRNL
jgi:hypothetical protein